jgi:hypothetical protein
MGGLYGGYGYNYCAPPVYSYPIYTQPVVQRQVIHTYPQQQQQAPTQIIITKKKEATQEPGKEKQSPSKEDGQVQAQTPPAQVVVQPSNPQVRYVQKQPRKRGCCSIVSCYILSVYCSILVLIVLMFPQNKFIYSRNCLSWACFFENTSSF